MNGYESGIDLVLAQKQISTNTWNYSRTESFQFIAVRLYLGIIASIFFIRIPISCHWNSSYSLKSAVKQSLHSPSLRSGTAEKTLKKTRLPGQGWSNTFQTATPAAFAVVMYTFSIKMSDLAECHHVSAITLLETAPSHSLEAIVHHKHHSKSEIVLV